MKNLSIKSKIVYLIAVFTMVSYVFAACDNKGILSSDEDKVSVYYINESRTGLTSKKQVLTSKDRDGKIEEILTALKETEVNNISALGKVEIVETKVESRNLTVVMTSAYDGMNTLEKMLLRTAVVLSFTGVKGVESVEFFVGTEPVKYEDGTTMGPLKSSDFVDINNNDINNYNTRELTLYYSNIDGTKLRKISVECIYSNNVSIEKYVIEKLIESPDDANCKNALSSNSRVNSVITKDGVCYVDFADTVISDGIVDEEVSIYSIVNSLSELGHITRVQISVNGSTDINYGDIDLSKAFTRNLDIVENSEIKAKMLIK